MNNKDHMYYMQLPYRIEINQNLDEGGFDVSIPDLDGCVAWGETAQDALEILEEVKGTIFQIALDRGWPIPEPTLDDYKEYSGRFNVRLPSYLHRRLARTAQIQNTSLNQLVVSLLSEGQGRMDERAPVHKTTGKEFELQDPSTELTEDNYQQVFEKTAQGVIPSNATYINLDNISDASEEVRQ